MFMLIKRRAMFLGTLVAASAVAWRYRVLQVGGFAAAAGLNKYLHPDEPVNFRDLAGEWKTLSTSEIPIRIQSKSRGLITYHPWYHGFNPAVADRCLSEAAKLGGTTIRIDIRWMDVMPDGDASNEAAWEWYEGYLAAACDSYDLQPMIVLSNPSKQILGMSVESRLVAWQRYVQEVTRRFGSRCAFYQILNEPNNPVFTIFPRDSTFKAMATAAQIIRRNNSAAKTLINMLVDLPNWNSDLDRILTECGWAIDIVGFDFYPGTWAISSRSVELSWDYLANKIRELRSKSDWSLGSHPLAILETGYSTNLKWCRDATKQMAYFKEFGNALARLDEAAGPGGLRFVGVHELVDRNSEAGIDPEAHFGLIDSNAIDRKPTFETVRQLFQRLQ